MAEGSGSAPHSIQEWHGWLAACQHTLIHGGYTLNEVLARHNSVPVCVPFSRDPDVQDHDRPSHAAGKW